MSSIRRNLAAVTAASCLCANAALAQNTAQSGAQHDSSTQGPTVIRARFTLIDEYTRLPDNDYRNRILLQATMGLGEKRDYGLTIEVPYAQYRPGSVAQEQAATGLGDVRTFFVHTFYTQGQWSHSYALESYFDTAVDRRLGVGSTTLLPSYALTYRASKSFQTVLLTQYQFDIRRDDDVSPVRLLALRPFLVLNFPHAWYSFIEGKAVMDFDRDNNWAVTGTASLGKFLDEKKHVSVFAVVGGPLNRYARDNVQRYQLKMGMNYFF